MYQQDQQYEQESGGGLAGFLMMDAMFGMQYSLFTGHRVGVQFSPMLSIGGSAVEFGVHRLASPGSLAGRLASKFKSVTHSLNVSYADSAIEAGYHRAVSNRDIYKSMGKFSERTLRNAAPNMSSEVAALTRKYSRRGIVNSVMAGDAIALRGIRGITPPTGKMNEKVAGAVMARKAARMQAKNAYMLLHGNSIVRELGEGVVGKGSGSMRTIHEGLKMVAGGSKSKYAAQLGKYMIRAGSRIFGGAAAGFAAGSVVPGIGNVIGTAIGIVGAGLLAKDVVELTYHGASLAMHGARQGTRSYRQLEFGLAPPDTFQASTGRQRALEEIARSRLNARSAFGNEAAYLHS